MVNIKIMKINDLVSQLLAYFTKDIENLTNYTNMLVKMNREYLKTGNMQTYQNCLAQINYVKERMNQARSFLKIFKLIFKNADLRKEIADLIKNADDITLVEKHLEPLRIVALKDNLSDVKKY